MERISCIFRYITQTAQKGFTLVELLVVIGLLGVIATVSIILINPQAQINKSNDGLRKSDLVKIQSALEIYRADNGDYPGNIGWCSQLSSVSYQDIRQALTPQYMSTLPTDPKFGNTTEDYYYWHNEYGEYRLYAVLEFTGDPKVVANVQGSDGIVGSCPGASNQYNYKVVSS